MLLKNQNHLVNPKRVGLGNVPEADHLIKIDVEMMTEGEIVPVQIEEGETIIEIRDDEIVQIIEKEETTTENIEIHDEKAVQIIEKEAMMTEEIEETIAIQGAEVAGVLIEEEAMIDQAVIKMIEMVLVTHHQDEVVVDLHNILEVLVEMTSLVTQIFPKHQHQE